MPRAASSSVRPVAWRGSEMMGVSAQENKIHLAVASWVPFRLNSTARTVPVCPFNSATVSPVAVSQTRSVASFPAVTASAPSAEKASDHTSSPWPSSTRASPVRRSWRRASSSAWLVDSSGFLGATLGAGTAAPRVDATATAAGRRHDLGAYPIGPGTRLAHFEIVRPLGHGGMGEVYLATDLALDRPVAIKVLPAALARDAGRRERMIREARAQARLNHPNVAHIYFIGEDLGQLFFAMEYVEGETLAQRLERGPLPTDVALELARQAALGLREAHRHGFTHRDIKPSNLMIDQHGLVKVMDFGLVTATWDADADALDGGAAPAASALVGTPLYMAPEQGQGKAVDHRADIYALGATLHHMIAGAPPFAGGSAAELLSMHETAPRASLVGRRVRRRVAGLADEAIARMMAKRPADRPASYDLLIAELDRANPVRSRPTGLWPRLVAALTKTIRLGTGIIIVPQRNPLVLAKELL